MLLQALGVFAIMVAASAAQALSGFGSALLAVPLISLMVGAKAAVVGTSLAGTLISLLVLLRDGRAVEGHAAVAAWDPARQAAGPRARDPGGAALAVARGVRALVHDEAAAVADPGGTRARPGDAARGEDRSGPPEQRLGAAHAAYLSPA